jgi:hypothetical protein
VKIPHRDLEEARQNPGAYVRRLSGREPRGFGPTLFRAWQLTIYRYHETGNPAAIKSDLEKRFKKFSSGPRQFDDYYENLQDYIRDFERLKHVVVDTKVRVNINLGASIQLVGEVSRVDLSPDEGYSAVLILSREQTNWQDQLRMPLLQRFFAENLSVALERVKVGVYVMEGKHEFVSYSASDVAEAEKEARSVARRLTASNS